MRAADRPETEIAMADIRIMDRAPDALRVVQFFDPSATFDFGDGTTFSLVSENGYKLVLEGTGFAYDGDNHPTAGVIADIFLYDASGELIGRIDGVSRSLADYYDQVVVDDQPNVFTASLLHGRDVITGGAADDRLEGYGGADTLSGGDGDDLVGGGTGSDRLSGGAGDDTIDGGTGNDVISGGSGHDLIAGGDGDDRLAGDMGRDTISGGVGNDVIEGGGGADLLRGDAGRDTISGGRGNDTIEGGTAADRLDGGSGSDYIDGGSGADVLVGGTGNDTLYGGLDDDRIYGGAGDDVLNGGGGNDAFVFEKLGDGVDVIKNYGYGGDHLVFEAAGFEGMTEDFDYYFGRNVQPAFEDPCFLYDTESHKLYWDKDGSGASERVLVAVLENVEHLNRYEIVVV